MAKATKKTAKLTQKPNQPEKPARKVAKPEYKSFRLQKKIKHPNKPLTGSFKLMKANIAHLMKYKRLFFGIAGVYFIASLILVNGIVGNTDYSLLKESVQELFTGLGGQITAGVTLFGVLLGGGGNSGTVSQTVSVYQTLLLIIVSLASIWALRQTYAKTKVTVKESFYKSMTPLVPFLVVIVVIGLQLIPLFIGTSLYAIVISNALAVTFVERVLWVMFLLGLVLLTLYMICSSIFAVYIVTLPDMTPMQALRSARELVRYRRWTIMRKLFFLPISLLVMMAVIMIPVLLYLTPIAQWVFTLLTMILVVVVHGYMYRLYRELL